MVGIILYRPEKPGNVGNIIRTCMASEAKLFIIGPLTFSLTEKELQRAGMDYIKESDFVIYKDYDEFLKDFLKRTFTLCLAVSQPAYLMTFLKKILIKHVAFL